MLLGAGEHEEWGLLPSWVALWLNAPEEGKWGSVLGPRLPPTRPVASLVASRAWQPWSSSPSERTRFSHHTLLHSAFQVQPGSSQPPEQAQEVLGI